MSILGTIVAEVGLALLILVLAMLVAVRSAGFSWMLARVHAWLPGLIFAVGLPFHLLIAICPSPNGAGGFSCTVAVWYLWLLPVESDVRSLRTGTDSKSHCASISCWIVACALIVALFVLGLDMQDFAMTVYGIMATILCAEFRRRFSDPKQDEEPSCIDTDCARRRRAGAPSDPIVLPKHRVVVLTTQLLLLLLFLAWSFGCAFLGIQDMGADTMYGGLQVYGAGRGNHILMPTGLIWEAQRRDSGDPVLYRVSSVASDGSADADQLGAATAAGQYLRTMYPAEAEIQPPAAAELLRSVGHTGRMFAPGAARVLGPAWATGAAPSASSLRAFQPYVVPELALRRMVWEARNIMREPAAQGRCSKEPCAASPDADRQAPMQIHVSPLAAKRDGSLISHQGQAVLKSKLLILVTAARVEVRCADTTAECLLASLVRERLEEALQRPLPFWVQKMLVFFPIPSGSAGGAGVAVDGSTVQPAGCVA